VNSIHFTLRIDQDGSAVNYIGNPSFEKGTDGWTGTATGTLIRNSDEKSLFGRFSLITELGPDSRQWDYIRESWILNKQVLNNATWSARSWVMIPGFSNAQAVMGTWIGDYEGNMLEWHSVKISDVTDEFVPLVIEGKMFPDDAQVVVISIGIQALKQGGSGIVFWDGVEFTSGVRLPRNYCDGDHPDCFWTGTPHFSETISNGGIESIALRLDNSIVLRLQGPFYTDDRLIFQPNGVVLSRPGSPETQLASSPSLQPGQTIDLIVTAKATPSMSIGLKP